MSRLGPLRCTRGASSAEFAMVLPLLLILLFGIIDGGRFVWDMNRAEKATQVGARMAVVTDTLSTGLIAENYAGRNVNGTTLGPGDIIPAAALGTVVCTESGCECDSTNGPCPTDSTTMDSDAFELLVARMKQIYPPIDADNVEVRYSGSGFGSAGSLAGGGGGGGGGGAPESMEISPLVTVSLKDMEFEPITSLLFARIPLPAFSTTMTDEDASGTISN